MSNTSSKANLILFIAITLIFFAANSIFSRFALIENTIDPYSYTLLRFFFGSLFLVIIVLLKEKKYVVNLKTNWMASFMLFLYAICFTYAYLGLDAGIGALILFAIIQLTIIITTSIKNKSELNSKKIFGTLLSFAGLVYLLYPKDNFSISIFHASLMVLAGIGSGFFTILGKKSTNALKSTSDIFVKSLVFILLSYFLIFENIHLSFQGIFLALISGGLTTGLTYALWYYILPQIKMTTAGIVQLTVPVIAIFLSVIFLNEEVTLSLLLSSSIILSGIAICIYKK